MTQQALKTAKKTNTVPVFLMDLKKDFFGKGSKKLTFLDDDDYGSWQDDDTDIDDFVRSFLY